MRHAGLFGEVLTLAGTVNRTEAAAFAHQHGLTPERGPASAED